MTIRNRLKLPLSLGRRLPALTADVSRGGFQAELPQVFLPGSLVDGYFLVDEAEVPFRGEVTWAVPGNPSLSLWSSIGVRFDKTPKGLEPVLKKLEARPRKLKRKR